jgi:hypothetical protein
VTAKLLPLIPLVLLAACLEQRAGVHASPFVVRRTLYGSCLAAGRGRRATNTGQGA